MGLGKAGDRVSYWFKRLDRYHSKTGRALKPMPVETNSGEYWAEYYIGELDEVYRSILGIDTPRTNAKHATKALGNTSQLKLELAA